MKINYTFIEAVVNPFALEPAPIDMYSHLSLNRVKSLSGILRREGLIF